ncbi:MAG: NAD-binding protein [Candidatus Hermodarchaeota archaeon]
MSSEIKSEDLWYELLTGKKDERQFNLPWILLQAWQRYGWIIIVSLGAGVLFFGTVGYWKYFTEGYHQGEPKNETPLGIFYFVFRFFTLEPDISLPLPKELEIARYLALLTLILLSLTLVDKFGGLGEFIHKRYEFLKLRFFKNHVIICGLDDKGIKLVTNFRENNIPVIVIGIDESNEKIRTAREKGAVVLTGDLTEEILLKKAHIKSAKYVIAVSSADDLNLEIAADSFRLISETRKLKRWSISSVLKLLQGIKVINKFFRSEVPLRCFVHLMNSELLTAFRERELFTGSPKFSLKLFNVYENAARLLFYRYPLDNFAKTVDEDAPPVHVVVIGFNEMGQNIVLQAVKLSSYANEKKIHFTIIDTDVEKKKKIFYRSFRQFDEVCTAFFEPIKDIDDCEQINKILLEKDGRPPISMIFICPKFDTSRLLCVKSLLEYLSDHRTSKGFKIPIFIHMEYNTGFTVLLQTEPQFINNFIQPFGMINQTCTRELVVHDSLSKLAQLFNKLHQKTPWEELSETKKDSNLQLTDHIPVKIRTIGCDIRELNSKKQSFFKFTNKEIETLARMEHKRWMIERMLKGYTLNANIEETNDETKQSPNLVLFEELRDEYKGYNRQSVTIIPEVLKTLGYEIYRLNEEADENC